MMLLVSNAGDYDRYGALARTAKLVELEQLERRRDAAVAKTGLADQPTLRSPEEMIELDADVWGRAFPDARGLLRECLEKVRKDRLWRGHWSGQRRNELATTIDRAYSDESGMAEMIDSTYGLLSMHAHPRPQVGGRETEVAEWKLAFRPKSEDLRLAQSIGYLSVKFATSALQRRNSWDEGAGTK
jgi:hypothetical protein